jgi:hypothetical protein
MKKYDSVEVKICDLFIVIIIIYSRYSDTFPLKQNKERMFKSNKKKYAPVLRHNSIYYLKSLEAVPNLVTLSLLSLKRKTVIS